jgi:hypothetical protein
MAGFLLNYFMLIVEALIPDYNVAGFEQPLGQIRYQS